MMLFPPTQNTPVDFPTTYNDMGDARPVLIDTEEYGYGTATQTDLGPGWVLPFDTPMVLRIPYLKYGMLEDILRADTINAISTVHVVDGDGFHQRDAEAINESAVHTLIVGQPRKTYDGWRTPKPIELTGAFDALRDLYDLKLFYAPRAIASLEELADDAAWNLTIAGYPLPRMAPPYWVRGITVLDIRLPKEIYRVRRLYPRDILRINHTDLRRDAMDCMSKHWDLTHVDLSYNRKLVPKLSYLTERVTELRLNGVRCRRQFRRLAPNPNLKVLEVERSETTDADLKHIAHQTGLKHLNLNRTWVTDRGIRNLAPHLPGLQRIDLRNRRHSAQLIRDLPELFPNLTHVGALGAHLDHTTIDALAEAGITGLTMEGGDYAYGADTVGFVQMAARIGRRRNRYSRRS